jgi:ABC-2 type transport system permease protein
MSTESLEKDSKTKVPAAEAAADEAEERDEDEREDDAKDEQDESDDDADDDGADDDDGAASGTSTKSAADAAPKEKVVIDRPGSASIVTTIFRRELASYFNSPISYIVIGASSIVLGLYFFLYKGGFWQVDRATMTRMFEIVPFALCLFTIPLFTMRSLSDEKRVGTIELLITMPVKDSEVILGKYFASLAMVTIQVALIALYPIAMFKWPWHIGELDWNPFWVGMLGLFFLSMAGTAIGLMWSAFTESQILSYFATMLTLVALYAVGSVSIIEFMSTNSSSWGWLGDGISFVSLQSRFEPFVRGIIDTRAIVYFLSLSVLGLIISFRTLESRKWS